MSERSPSTKASFLAFHLEYARVRNWHVPAIHVRACHWLEHECGDYGVMMCFRGFAKSTLLAEYNAWRYYRDAKYRILHQGADDQMAYKTSRDTQRVLRTHPWCKDLLPDRPGPVEQWWVVGSDDDRNASFFAKGITSTTTSSRADECQNDDVEVPKNITNIENRERMRDRLNEQVHIMVPGARHLFVGTPHTHDSLYDEHVRLGAKLLKIKMFANEYRLENAAEPSYLLPFVPEIVFSGIHEHARRLVEGDDYAMKGKRLTFVRPPKTLVDFYAGCAWPERFDAAELLKRRKKTRTINAWDSQYQLHSKPITETRLDPDRLSVYDVEPVITTANGEVVMMLGETRIVGASMCWDPSSGKINSDVSSSTVLFQDEAGRRYIHRVTKHSGDIAEFSEDGREVTGGQVLQLCTVIEEFNLPRITVETNGIGKFAPATLKAALKQRGLVCGVKEKDETEAKNPQILEALEPLLLANEMLWAHTSVMAGPLPEQMRGWNPAVRTQPDDYLDSTAKAIRETPERVGKLVKILPARKGHDWRPAGGVYAVITH